MVEYYFDIESTHYEFDKAEIITIQWQRLNGYTGEPIGVLNILKRWEYEDKKNAEKEIIKTFIPYLRGSRWDFVFAGKNLTFDFCLLDRRMRLYGLGEFDIQSLYNRVVLDIKPLLVLMNKGSFKGYDSVLPKTNPLENKKIPELYEQEKYGQITQYIKDEAKDFINAYQILKKEMPKLKSLINKTS